MSVLCSKLQIHASNFVGGVAETQTVLQCDMVKISMSVKGYNSGIITCIKILFPSCKFSMHIQTVLQVSYCCFKYCRSLGDTRSTTVCYGQNIYVIKMDIILQ